MSAVIFQGGSDNSNNSKKICKEICSSGRQKCLEIFFPEICLNVTYDDNIGGVANRRNEMKGIEMISGVK